MTISQPISPPPAWQRLVINPLTALFFAFCTGVAFYRFPVIDVPGVAWLSAGVVFSSYLMLAKKYDPILSAMFFAIALFLLYKTAVYQPRTVPAQTQERALLNELATVASLAQTAALRDGQPPQKLAELPLGLLTHQPDGLTYCLSATCSKKQPTADAVFWVAAPASFLNDKPQETWYLNDRFQAFRQTANGSFEAVNP